MATSNYSYLTGDAVYTVGSECGSEGTAMFDAPSTESKFPWPPELPTGPHCWRMTAHPIIIGASYMSYLQAMQTVNFDFATNGDQPSIPNSLGLNAVVV